MMRPQLAKARQPFRFFTALVLQEATGLRAATLPQLLRLLRDVPDGCIYHHTHHFLLQHHYLTPEPTNDFAYWTSRVLGEEALGELLASIDTIRYDSLQKLRQALIQTVEGYLQRSPLARFKFASEGEEFFFVKSIHVIVPTSFTASNLQEFAEALAHVSRHSLYHHIFDARLRLGHSMNDFSLWFEQELGEHELAKEVVSLDPYAYTLEALRSILLDLIRKRLVELSTEGAQPLAGASQETRESRLGTERTT